MLCRPDPARFSTQLRSLDIRFRTYAATCPVPLPAPGLIVTPEIRRQSELYLPLSEIRNSFYLLYRCSLSYPPILTSTLFHTNHSWADLYASLPHTFQDSANPAALLRRLLDDPELLTTFLLESFLPGRFYGGFKRYPGQLACIGEWVGERLGRPLRCLDAACGTGEGSYDLAILLRDLHWRSELIQIEGWTVEPLEVWAAAHCRFPSDPDRETMYRSHTETLFKSGISERISFRSADLRDLPRSVRNNQFDLILCNGLLGGPIINRVEEMKLVVGNLAGLLSPGGVLLAADSFHDGWKKKIPGDFLGDLFRGCGLNVQAAGEGLAARKLE